MGFFSKGWIFGDGSRISAPPTDGTVGQALISNGDGTSDWANNGGARTVAAGKLSGRRDSGSGDEEDITLGSGLSMSGTTVSVTASTGLPEQYITPNGLEISNNATDGDHDIDISAGRARSVANNDDLVLASAITKQIDATWSVGTGAGGLDTGTVAANETYHVHLIKRSDTGVVDALFSLSATAPTMPTNYDRSRRIMAVETDASANIIPIVQRGNVVRFKTPILDVNANNPGTSAVLRTLTVPSGVYVQAILISQVTDVSYTAATYGIISDPAMTDFTPNFDKHNTAIFASGSHTQPSVPIELTMGTNTSSQVRTRLTQSTADHYWRIQTHGWIDPRI